MSEVSPLLIVVAAIFTNTILLSNFLGMCSFLACSREIPTAIGLGTAVTFVMTCTTTLNYLIYHHVLLRFGLEPLTFIVFIVVIAAFVTVVDMLLKAYQYELSRSLGLFVPLIVVNCIILGRAEAFASRNTILRSALDGVGMALGFTLALFFLGAVREIIGSGTITFFQMGETEIKFNLLGEQYPGILVMILPPGAFLALGFMLAARNAIQKRLDKKRR